LRRACRSCTTSQQRPNGSSGTPQIHPQNCSFPFDDHHQNLIHCLQVRPHSPSQTASQSIHMCGHCSHVRTDRWKRRDECSVPRALCCMQRRANNLTNYSLPLRRTVSIADATWGSNSVLSSRRPDIQFHVLSVFKRTIN